MGFGANAVTGDYSLGGSGIWIENGELAYPVEGITVAANMRDILKRIDMVGDDLVFMGSVASPTFRVSEMTVSGG
jgi:PmbA protein